jgi:hypothetical protein
MPLIHYLDLQLLSIITFNSLWTILIVWLWERKVTPPRKIRRIEK